MDSVAAAPSGAPTRAGAILRHADRHPLYAAWQLRVVIEEARAVLQGITAPGPEVFPGHADAEQAFRAHRALDRIDRYQTQLDLYLAHPSTRRRPAREVEQLRLAATDPKPSLLDFADCKLARLVAKTR